MSCITELLKHKGNKEYLIATDQIAIESGGTYKGYEYMVVFTSSGHRCGYVAIESSHPLYNMDLMESNWDDESILAVHGGITFYEDGSHITSKILHGHHCDDKWIGFDAAHGGDAHDYGLAMKVFPNKYKNSNLNELYKTLPSIFLEGEIRDNLYMEHECKSLIDQIIKKHNLKDRNNE